LREGCRRIFPFSKKQFDFIPGSSTMEAIYLFRRLMGLHRDRKVNLYMMFINLKKAYDRVPHEVLRTYLEKKGVSPVYIGVIKDMYEGCRTSVTRPGGATDDFYVGVGLY